VNRYAEIDFSQYPVKYTERRDDRFGNQLNYTLTDCKGDIVFSVGITGYFLNRNLDTIPGGGLLYGNSRSSVLNGVQFPNSKDSIFVVHTNYLDKKHSTYWSLVNLSANSGNGKVVKVNQLLESFNNDNLAIVPHSNKRDFWILTTPDSFTLNAHLLSDTGISAHPIQSSGYFNINDDKYDWLSKTISVSRDGKSLFSTFLRPSIHTQAAVLMFEFDNSTGKLSNPKKVVGHSELASMNNVATKVSLSPNDTFAYFGSGEQLRLYPFKSGTWDFFQYNRFTGELIRLTRGTSYDREVAYKGVVSTALAPNGRVYCSVYEQVGGKGWVVNHPNFKGMACKFRKDYTLPGAFRTTDAYSPITWPYYTATSQIDECTDTTTFYMGGDTGVYKMVLRFGDGDTLLYTGKWYENLTFKHYYRQNGKYPVTMITWSNYCNVSRTIIDTLEVYKPPVYVKRGFMQKAFCNGDSLKVVLKGENQNRYSVNWGVPKPGGGEYDSISYGSKDSIVLSFFYHKDSGSKQVLTTTIANDNCPNTQIDTVYVKGLPVPKPKLSLSKSIFCAGDILSISDSTFDRTTTYIDWISTKDTFTGLGIKVTSRETLPAKKDSMYSVFAHIINSYGCETRDTLHFLSKAAPLASLSILDSVICAKQQKLRVAIRTKQNPTGTVWTINDGSFTHYDTNFTQGYVSSTSSRILAAGSYNGCEWIDSLPFRVAGLPAAGFIINNDTQCFAGHKLNIVNNTNSPNESIDSFWYDMDNGTKYRTADVSNHLYSVFGNYIIKQKVQTSEGCLDSISKPVLIKESPRPNWQTNTLRQCSKGNEIQVDEFTKGTSSIAWGDGLFDGNIHHYAQSGNYTIRLIKDLGNQCADTQYRAVNLLAHPKASFTRDTACTNNPFTLTETSRFGSSRELNPAYWTITGARSKTGTSVSYTLPDSGWYTLTLISSDTSNCSDTVKRVFKVHPSPIPQLSFEPFGVSTSSLVYQFTALPLNMKNYVWDFGVGGTGQARISEGRFLQDKKYPIKLSIEDYMGCKANIDSQVHILGLSGFHLPSAFSPNGDGLNETWGIEEANYIRDVHIRIFNQRGKVMFKILNPNDRWDASNAAMDTYGYKGYIRDIYNRFQEVEGVIQIVR